MCGVYVASVIRAIRETPADARHRLSSHPRQTVDRAETPAI